MSSALKIDQRMIQYCAVPNITDIDSSSFKNNRTANAHKGSQPHHTVTTALKPICPVKYSRRTETSSKTDI
jgi:hypothetical protein